MSSTAAPCFGEATKPVTMLARSCTIISPDLNEVGSRRSTEASDPFSDLLK